MEPIIKLEHVNVVYGAGRTNEKVALNDISLEIFPGEYIVFFGPSGCGKSTLLYTIAGLEVPTSGVVQVEGHDLLHLSPQERIHYYRQTIGMVFQAFYLVPQLSARDNMILPQMFAHIAPPERIARAELLMQQFGITEFAGRKPSMMSGGQQQRTAIGRSLMNDPAIILADEPVGNLDTKNAQIVLDLLAEVHAKQKKTVIQVTHNPRDVTYADRIFYMKDGKIERIVRNTQKALRRDEEVPNDIEQLAQDNPQLEEIQLQARLIVRYLISPYDLQTEREMENAVARYIKGEIKGDELFHQLDDQTGAGLYSQKAAEYRQEVEKLVHEMRMLNPKSEESHVAESTKVETVRRHILDHYHKHFHPNQVAMLDELIRQRIEQTITDKEFMDMLRATEKKGGLGVRWRTAQHFARELQLAMIAQTEKGGV